METGTSAGFHQPPRGRLILFRVLGQFTTALLAVSIPAVGDNRFWLAGILLFVAIPVSLVLCIRFRSFEAGWIEPLFDLMLVLGLVHLAPHLWNIALCLAVMTSLAPSISLHPRSYRIYLILGALLTGGLVFAALVHGVENWILPIVSVAAIYPAIVFYAYWQVRRADELRERAQLFRSVTQLAGMVAHDFNNVLMGISGHAELACHELPEDHPASRSLAEVIDGVNRASLLCGQLLTFSGRDVQGYQQIELVSELKMITSLLQAAIPKGIEIRLRPAQKSLYVAADRSQLQQVMMNVILNAGEALGENPKPIEIQIAPKEQFGKNWVQVKVRDYGCGVPSSELEKIFDPFYTTKEQGHGLGLASARKIMQNHGGNIELASETGNGTCVSIKLPAATGPQPSSIDRPMKIPLTGTRGRILVVDDEPQIREVAAGFLEKLGFDALTARDANEAEILFESGRGEFYAVLLDLKMPGRDGWDCLRELRAINRETPIIICSGFDPNDQPATSAWEDPNVEFLSKPFRIGDLAEVLANFSSQSIDSNIEMEPGEWDPRTVQTPS